MPSDSFTTGILSANTMVDAEGLNSMTTYH